VGVLFHISAESQLMPHARSNSAFLPAAGAGTRARRVGRGRPRDQSMVESLVIPFEMIGDVA
jgi:hypothetical protein